MCYNKIILKIYYNIAAEEAVKMNFSLHSEKSENKKNWLIDVSGEIDIFNSGEFKQKLLSLLEEDPLDIKINCLELSYIDSTGLGSLIAVLKQAKSTENGIYLSNLKPSLSKLFKVTNLDKVFIIEGDANE